MAKNKNILLVEQFINGLKNKDVNQLPLHENVELYSPLRPGHIIRGSSVMREFLSQALPKLPITGVEIEKHITQDFSVCTLWKLHVEDFTVSIFDYFEIEDNMISVVRPYFDPVQLNNLLK